MHLLAVTLVLLHGVVMRGPTQPVCQIGKPCSEPAADVKLVFSRNGVAVKSVTTGDDGRYAVKLARGTYTVAVRPAMTIGRGIEPRRFTLTVARRLDFDIDTGIR
jgi:hypothetical protein